MKSKPKTGRQSRNSYLVTMENGEKVVIKAANADTAMMIASQERKQRVWSVQ